jgi:hypothetical protein
MEQSMKTKLTSYQQGSPANLSPKQGSVRELVMNVRFGHKFAEFYGKQNPNGSWAKTCQDSLQLMEDNTSGKSSMTWPKLGIALDGLCTGQKTLVLFTEGTECSSLPTPRASQDHKPIRPLAPSEANGTHGKTLVADIGNHLLPTPTVQDAKNNGSESQQKRNTKPLNAVAINLSLEETGSNGESPLRLGLNPEFVEAMMGFPIGWTDLNLSETP